MKWKQSEIFSHYRVERKYTGLTLDEWVDSEIMALYGLGCTGLITSSMLDGGLSSIGSFVCSQFESL